MTITAKLNKLSPLLKYPGGKDKELSYILPNIPYDCTNYYDEEHYKLNIAGRGTRRALIGRES